MLTAPRLDRLSAVLAGVGPRVEVTQPALTTQTIVHEASSEQFLHLYLLTEGQVGFSAGPDHLGIVQAPAVIVCRADLAHALDTGPATAFCGLLCAKAVFDGPVGTLLFAEFAEPEIISLQGSADSLSHVIQLIASELHAPRCGQPLLLDRAGDILLIGLLRHLIAHPRRSGGLFNGLADPRIARALVALHARPQAGWTLETLADAAGMSRTAFANTFREVMGQTPGKYLSTLRLAIAQGAVKSGLGLKRAARESGYLSASALSRALGRSKHAQI